MITTTASHATSLFQYIDDQRSSTQFVGDMNELAQNSGAQDVKDIDSGLVNVQSMDTLVDRVMSGESKVTGEKVNDMLSFYFNQVKSELEDSAGDFNLQNVPPIQMVEGQWQLAQSSGNKNLNNFVDYLNKDQRLSSRMEKAMKLSELNEQIQARSSAETLKNENTPDEEITDFLISTSDKLQANRFLSIEQGSVKLGNAGITKEQLASRDQSTS